MNKIIITNTTDRQFLGKIIQPEPDIGDTVTLAPGVSFEIIKKSENKLFSYNYIMEYERIL